MTQHTIIEHIKRLPHKQSFKVTLSTRISEEELAILTQKISEEHRVANERMFFNWWTSTQNIASDICWAHSSWDGTYQSGSNLMSQEEFLESVEMKPLKEDNELGLWFWDLGEISSYIHLLPSNNNKIQLRRDFLDGSSANRVIDVISNEPLKLQWTDDEYLILEGDDLTICDHLGEAVKLIKIR